MAKQIDTAHAPWPVLKRYTGEQLTRIAMPIGGIGTGTISLGGRGQLTDWELRDHPDKGFAPTESFFALWTRDKTGRTTARCLEGAIPPCLHERAQSGGPDQAKLHNASLPRFDRCSFEVAYPLAQVKLSDSDVPLRVRIEAMNPMAPAGGDADDLPRWSRTCDLQPGPRGDRTPRRTRYRCRPVGITAIQMYRSHTRHQHGQHEVPQHPTALVQGGLLAIHPRLPTPALACKAPAGLSGRTHAL